jgi:hypothetical protein
MPVLCKAHHYVAESLETAVHSRSNAFAHSQALHIIVLKSGTALFHSFCTADLNNSGYSSG